MSLRDVVLRLLGREVAKTHDIERADRVLDAVASIRVTLVPTRAFLDDFKRQDSALRPKRVSQ